MRALLVLVCLVGAGVGFEAKFFDSHHYSYYPCLPREPPRSLIPGSVPFMVPRKNALWVDREDSAAWPVPPERTVVVWINMLKAKRNAARLRLLWLFNRSNGMKGEKRFSSFFLFL